MRFVVSLLVVLLVLVAVESRRKPGRPGGHSKSHSKSHSRSPSQAHTHYGYSHPLGFNEHCCCVEDWTFAVTFLEAPSSFLDTDDTIQGFDIDLINKVCECAGKSCDIIWQPLGECARSVDGNWFPGSGIMDGWFEVCPWWGMQTDRQRSMDFCGPYKGGPGSRFAIPATGSFDSTGGITGLRIAVVPSFVSNEGCLNDMGFTGFTTVVVADTAAGVAAVVADNADAFFTSTSEANISPLVYEPADQIYKCDTQGVGMMVTRRSQLCGHYFTDWWTYGFQKIVDCGCYQHLCDHWGTGVSCKDDIVGDPTNCSAEDCTKLGDCCQLPTPGK